MIVSHRIIENIVRLYTITSLVKAINARDDYTMSHCERVTSYAVRLAEYIDCSDEVIDALCFAGPIHDVGKIGVRDEILLKPTVLDSGERDIMQDHVTIGDEIVKHLNLGHLEYAIMHNHHERFDGNGYPDRLKGNEIPLVARIASVVDAYDAMIADRPYRPAMSHEESVAELLRCRGTQFDGELVNTFIEHGIYKEEDGQFDEKPYLSKEINSLEQTISHPLKQLYAYTA